MTHVTNTGDVDLDITVNGAFIHAPAGATVEVPDDVASRLPDVFDVPDDAKPKARKPRKPRARQPRARQPRAAASEPPAPEPTAPTGDATTEES